MSGCFPLVARRAGVKDQDVNLMAYQGKGSRKASMGATNNQDIGFKGIFDLYLGIIEGS